MSATAQPTRKTETSLLDQTARLVGGTRTLGRKIKTSLDAHEVVAGQLPGAALHHLVASFSVLDLDASLEKAMGLSRRTFQRTKERPERPLSVEQSGRTWKFAEVLALASDVLGSQQLAERWLERPAVGLDGKKPLDMLSTPTGVELVETYLQRIKHGVYT